MALLFTVVIGFQIINTLDVNRRISDLIQWQNLIEANYINYLKLAQNLQAGISKSTADLQEAKGQYLDAFVFYNRSLYYAIVSDQPNQSIGLTILRRTISKIHNPVLDYLKKQNEILKGTELIRNTDSYRNCFGKEYEDILKELCNKMALLGYGINKNN